MINYTIVITEGPADTQVDLEVGFKLFFFTDSCSPDLAGQESDWCHIGIIEAFWDIQDGGQNGSKIYIFLVLL